MLFLNSYYTFVIMFYLTKTVHGDLEDGAGCDERGVGDIDHCGFSEVHCHKWIKLISHRNGVEKRFLMQI